MKEIGGVIRLSFMETNDKKEKFEEIYRKEVDAVFRFTLLRVSDREEVLDIVQDTFVKFWTAFRGEKEIRHYRSFIFTIARNKIIDWYRKKKPISLDAITEAEEENNGHWEVEDEQSFEGMKISAEAAVILKALNKLSSQYKEVVHLRFVEDMSPSEIAEILELTPNAVSIRISRGLEELRKILKINTE